ncbi:hypothetical protein D7V21_16880, partial [Acinetobacter guerrae]
MAYYSGQAASFSELLSVLVNACVEQGWIWVDNILSKDQIGIKLQIVNNHITALAGDGSTLANPAPAIVRMGALDNQTVKFPVDYYLFIFENPDEVYLIIKYELDKFLWLCFGCSILNLPASGAWVAAIKAVGSSDSVNIGIDEGGTAYTGNPTSAAPFWNTKNCHNSFFQHGFETLWSPNSGQALSTIGSVVANGHMGALISRQPNRWNSETIMLPIILLALRSSSKKSYVAEIVNARFLRIDNYDPEEIITYGADKWKVFPFYKKDVLNKDGGGYRDSSGT